MKNLLLLIVSLLLLLTNLLGREADVHEHGHASMTIAYSEDQIKIDFDTPVFNLMGFEHPPSKPKDKKRWKEVLEFFKKSNLSLANCKLKDVDLHDPFEDDDHDDKDEHNGEDKHNDDDNHAEHNDFEAEYLFNCTKKINQINFKPWFNEFDHMDELEANWISDTLSGSSELTSKKSVIIFK